MKILSVKTPYECPIFKVEEREVVVNGVRQTHWVVIRQPNVGVIALTEDNKILLIKETRGKDDEVVISIPSGKAGEFEITEKQARVAALNELHEETGYTTKHIELLQKYSDISNWRERDYFHFIAWDAIVYKGKRAIDQAENIQLYPVSLNEASVLVVKHALNFEYEHKSLGLAVECFKSKHRR